MAVIKPASGVSSYKPQTLSHTSRILLPARFNAAAVLLLLLVASAAVFVSMQPHNSEQARYPTPPSPIARAEAAPIVTPVTVPASDPRLDEVAALMPAETAESLPASPKASAPAKARPVNLSIRPKPQPAPVRPASQLETLAAQGIAFGRQGDYKAAEQSLRAALALDRGNPVILYNLGVVAERSGDRDSARTLYEATLRQAADHPATSLRPESVSARLDALDTQPDSQER